MSHTQERGAFEAWMMDFGSAEEINFEKLRAGNRVFDEYAVKEIESMWLAWKARAAIADRQQDAANKLKSPESDCPYCNGTGECDSGASHPGSGAEITIPCQCLYEDPFHVHVSKLDAIKAERDALRAVNAELVDACQELLEVYGVDDVHRWMALREQARAALAKSKELKGTE